MKIIKIIFGFLIYDDFLRQKFFSQLELIMYSLIYYSVNLLLYDSI